MLILSAVAIAPHYYYIRSNDIYNSDGTLLIFLSILAVNDIAILTMSPQSERLIRALSRFVSRAYP